MPRSGAEARARLQHAALELYSDRGYDGTTTADIAERAGVNHRTFFRHFADKREVLFDGQDALRDDLVRAVAEAPDGLPSMEVLLRAFLASAHVLESRQDLATSRMRLIASTPALLERDLAKGAAIAEALAGALVVRGELPAVALLTATVGWSTFHHAAARWTQDPEHPLGEHLTAAFDDLARAAESLRNPAAAATALRD